MLTSPLRSLLALTLVYGPALAQPLLPSCPPGVRHLEVPLEPSQPRGPQVCISPGQATLFNFDAKLAPDSVTLEGVEGFSLVEPGASTLKLLPSERVVLGAPLRLTVRFADGDAPASATFVLVAHPAHAEPLVDVHRQTRTVASYRQELRATAEEARQLLEENVRLRADRAAPGGLTGLLASAVMDNTGVAARELTESLTLPEAPLRVTLAATFRSKKRVAVALELVTPAGAPAWRAGGAALIPRGGRGAALPVLTVWSQEPLAPGETRTVVVEATLPPEGASGPYTLKLWEAGGTRTVTLEGVTFP